MQDRAPGESYRETENPRGLWKVPQVISSIVIGTSMGGNYMGGKLGKEPFEKIRSTSPDVHTRLGIVSVSTSQTG